ncbi:hypothetical protein [Marinobacter zhanjiangensis]|uniref:MSHA biogenesis protein MshK n=1 Tax=Marinobacter zhanjiangensis TaxID=578215 RepID=A0ABQ3B6J0_9GAMM|nr:hypothetical protein [Marinobacter zhanjiangensis]GGY80898.1 hypothetical protein GCM10007071_30330 [Marinobacter zhanjiangensis]
MARLLIVILLLVGPGAAMALQDPTRPSGQQTTPAPAAAESRQFALSSILYGPQRRVAVIDGVPRSEGDTFDGVRLRRIYPARVELVVQGQVREVRLTALPSIRTSK